MFLGADDVEYMPPRRFGDATTATPGFFSTPDDLLNAAKQTNDAVMAIHNAIDANRKSKHATVPKSARDEWVPFVTGWSTYYATNFSSRARVLLHWATSDLQGTLRNYQGQVSDWANKLKRYGVDITGSLPEGTTGGGRNVMMWVGIGAVTLIGLFVIGKLVHTVALGNAALTEAEEDAMRIADEKQRKRRDRTAFSIT